MECSSRSPGKSVCIAEFLLVSTKTCILLFFLLRSMATVLQQTCQLFETGNFSQCLWKDESHHSLSVLGYHESGVELMSPTQSCSGEEVALLHRAALLRGGLGLAFCFLWLLPSGFVLQLISYCCCSSSFLHTSAGMCSRGRDE